MPLGIGTLIIGCAPSKYMTKQQKKVLIKTINVSKKHLKAYKGLKIIEIHAADGTYIAISV